MGKSIVGGLARSSLIVGTIGSLALFAGCDRNEQKAMAVDRDRDRHVDTDTHRDDQKTITPERAQAIGAAVQSITDARCNREMRCKNIGADEDYATRDACVSAIRTKVSDDLNGSECTGGVDQKELNECLEEIRNDDCNNPLDSLGRIAACRTSDLCLHK